MIKDTYGLNFETVLLAVYEMLKTFADSAGASSASEGGQNVGDVKAAFKILRTLFGQDHASAITSDDDQLPHVATLLANPNAKVEYATLALATVAVIWGAQMTETPWREVLGQLEESILGRRIDEPQ